MNLSDGLLYRNSPDWFKATLLDAELFSLINIEDTLNNLTKSSKSIHAQLDTDAKPNKEGNTHEKEQASPEQEEKKDDTSNIDSKNIPTQNINIENALLLRKSKSDSFNESIAK